MKNYYKQLNAVFFLTVHTVHRVIDHGKVLPVKEELNGIKIEDSLKKFDMRFGRRDDLHNDTTNFGRTA